MMRRLFCFVEHRHRKVRQRDRAVAFRIEKQVVFALAVAAGFFAGYQRSGWRQEYPVEVLAVLEQIVQFARAANTGLEFLELGREAIRLEKFFPSLQFQTGGAAYCEEAFAVAVAHGLEDGLM